MKKQNLLKLALVSLAMFVFTGAWAQTAGTTVPGSADVTFTATGEFHMIEGTTIPIYVLPDPVYHPWTYGSNWNLADDFTWTWTVDGAVGNITFGATNGTTDNYVEVTAIVGAAAGSPYEISVVEKASPAFGGCESDPVTLDLYVYEAPDATLGANAGYNESLCLGDPTIPAALNLTISGGWQNYRLAWNLEIYTLDENGVADEWFDTDLTTSLGVVSDYAIDNTESVPEEVAASGAHAIMTVGSFTTIGDKPTVFVYTIESINDQAMRFGQYISFAGDYASPAADDFSYNAISETFTIQINPIPVTGPIYHIPATWAN